MGRVQVLGKVSNDSTIGNIGYESGPGAVKEVIKYLDPQPQPLVFSVNTNELGAMQSQSTHGSELAFVVDEIMKGPYGPRLVVNPEGLPQSMNSTIDKLVSRCSPKDKLTAIRMSQDYAETDDFLGGLIDMLIDFTMTGFDLQVSVVQRDGSDSTTLEEKQKISIDTQNFLNKFQKEFDFKKVITDLARDRKVTDNMILYWRIDKSAAAGDGAPSSIPGLTALYALNPADVEWDNSYGSDTLYVRIPEELILRVRKVLEGERVSFNIPDSLLIFPVVSERIKDLIASGIPLKWIEAIRLGLKMVQLSNEDGDYWIVSTRQRKNYGLAKPTMYRIFLSIETRQSLTQGEFTAGFMTKHFIMLIQQGESIDNGPLSGQRLNWLKKPDADALHAKFSDTSKAMRMVADHTLKVSFIFPDPKIFGTEKFLSCQERILNWAGATTTIVTGEGGTYSSAFIGIKRMISSIGERRSQLSDITTKFFNHPTIAPYVPAEEQTDVIAVFDEQVLKEPAQLLKELELLLGNNAMDPRTALRVFGYNPDRIRDSKFRARKEDEMDESWSPLQDSENENNGNSGVDRGRNGASKTDKGGRPPNPDTTPNPESRLQAPSPNS